MILVKSIAASIQHRLSIRSRPKSFTSDVLQKCCLFVLHSWQLDTMRSPTAKKHYDMQPWSGHSGQAHCGVKKTGFYSTHTHTHTCWRISIQGDSVKGGAAVSQSVMNETEVIEHVYSEGGAFKLCCTCKCFTLIGGQKRFLSRGDYRCVTRATEKKFYSDLMSWRLEFWGYACKEWASLCTWMFFKDHD